MTDFQVDDTDLVAAGGPPPAVREPTPEPTPPRPPLPRWKKVLLAGAGVSVVIGLVLLIVEPAAAPTGGGATPPGGGAGLVPDGVARSELPAGADGGTTWSPLFLKMGFSFFVGFAVGYVLRTFLKLTLLIAGVIALALFGLQQAGLVEVQWDRMGEMFDALIGHVREQASGLQTLLTGSLPAAGLGGLGLFTGFRKG